MAGPDSPPLPPPSHGPGRLGCEAKALRVLTNETASAPPCSVPHDDDPGGTEIVDTGLGAQAEHAGRPSADRD